MLHKFCIMIQGTDNELLQNKGHTTLEQGLLLHIKCFSIALINAQ